MSDQDQQPQQIEASDEQKLAWTAPKVTQFKAGQAELGDFSSPDGNIAS